MSGHSKWSQIKHKKGAADAKRGQVFSKLVKEITIAAREAGVNPDANPRLRAAMERARSEGLPKDNMERAIDSYDVFTFSNDDSLEIKSADVASPIPCRMR
mgnify:CR=1 FL=1